MRDCYRNEQTSVGGLNHIGLESVQGSGGTVLVFWGLRESGFKP